MRFESDIYTGDGEAARTIPLATGFGVPDVVIVKSTSANKNAVYKSINYTGADSRRMIGSVETTDGITALLTDGFRVDVNVDVNLDMNEFTYLAFRDDDGDDFEYGTYTGNGDAGDRTVGLTGHGARCRLNRTRALCGAGGG